MENEKRCYGRIFPSVLELKHNIAVRGHVFGYEVECSGLSTGDRSVVADTENWRGCLRCPEFDECYRFSTAMLLMEIAVKLTSVMH